MFTLAQRREIKKTAKSKPAEHGLAFSRWSLAKLADFLVAEGVVEDISHEGLRALLRAEGVSFQAVKTWKASADPDYAAKKARVDHLYAIADGEAAAGPSDPDVVFCLDLCRHRDYAERQAVGLVTEDGWLAIARHSYRPSRKASILSVGW